jgi:sulfopyruvate decarboxylase TPP-binding subunit
VSSASVGVPAEAVFDALRRARATHAVVVPDTNQRTVLELLDDAAVMPVIRCAAEDDAFGVCAGLWLAGHRPVAVIQQLGLFAGVNALRGMVHDQRVPLAVLAGVYGRDLTRKLSDDPASAVRLCTPLLDALEIPWSLIESPQDASSRIGDELTEAFDSERPRVVLLGAPTT